MKDIYIRSRRVSIDEDIRDIEIYLENRLSLHEFETIFEHARLRREAYFQDREGHHYVAKYENGKYSIEKI